MNLCRNQVCHSRIWLRLIGVVVLLLWDSVCLFAQKAYTLESIPNVRLHNPLNHVSNPDMILSETYVDSINYVLNILEDSTGIEVAVVAITSVENDEVRLFASDLFNRWGIGKKEKDNGLLIMLVTKPEQRAVVFETGYGLEGILPDATCFRIQQDYMLPEMKESNYSLGMYKGVKKVATTLYREIDVPKENESDSGDWIYGLILVLVIGVFIYFSFYVVPLALVNFLIFLILRIVRRVWPKTCPKCHQRAYRMKKEKILKWPGLWSAGYSDEYYVCKHCGHEHRNRQTINEMTSWGVLSGCSSSRYSRGGDSSSRGSNGGSWGGGSSGGGGSISNF